MIKYKKMGIFTVDSIIKPEMGTIGKYINNYIYIFLFKLLIDIFIKTEYVIDLSCSLKVVNEKIIKNEEKFITNEYSIKNFKNIIDFVKSQNCIFAGEIIRGILIKIFGSVFETNKNNTISKYIYNNLSMIKNKSNFDLAFWFQEDLFKPSELRNIKSLLIKDNYACEDFELLMNRSPFFYLLYTINEESYKQLFHKRNNHFIDYINQDIYENEENMKRVFCFLENRTDRTLNDDDIVMNSITNITSNVYFNNENPNFPLGPIREFFISVFIYYQNKNSPLMKFNESPKNEDENKNNEEIVNIPYEYNINGAHIEGRFSKSVISPIFVEPNISKLDFQRNNIREVGLYDLSKSLIFNNNIKEINMKISLIKSIFIGYMNTGFGIFDNHGVETLNFSHNYLKEVCGNDLAKLLSHFKDIKTLNLNFNELKGGLSHFLIALRKLYRKGKIELENLFLERCQLDESSFYELGELLKCKFCKLKKLYLNDNQIPLNINFLKKFKKNKSLNEIYLGKTDVCNRETEDIVKIMSNTSINYLYLHKNGITNINEFLRIIYRTKLIRDYNNSNTNSNIHFIPILTNLDLSNNDCLIKNPIYIKLLTKIIKETSLECLDISHILYGPHPDKGIHQQPEQYINSINKLVNILEHDKQKYTLAKKELISNKVDIKNLKNEENEKKFNYLEEKIDEILKCKKAKFPVFLKENAKKLIKYKNINGGRNLEDNKNEDYKQTEKNLIDYMTYKRANIFSKILEEEINKRNLIII